MKLVHKLNLALSSAIVVVVGGFATYHARSLDLVGAVSASTKGAAMTSLLGRPDPSVLVSFGAGTAVVLIVSVLPDHDDADDHAHRWTGSPHRRARASRRNGCIPRALGHDSAVTS